MKNKNKFVYVISIIMVITMLCHVSVPAFATEEKNKQPDYSNTDMEFAEDRVLVVLTQEASLRFL